MRIYCTLDIQIGMLSIVMVPSNFESPDWAFSSYKLHPKQHQMPSGPGQERPKITSVKNTIHRLAALHNTNHQFATQPLNIDLCNSLKVFPPSIPRLHILKIPNRRILISLQQSLPFRNLPRNPQPLQDSLLQIQRLRPVIRLPHQAFHYQFPEV